MVTRLQHLLAVLALAGLVGTMACQQRQEVEEEEADTLITEEADTLPAVPPPADTEVGMDTAMGMDTGVGAGAEAGAAEVAVTNSMPHAMIVKADWGEGENELGTVQSNETQNFTVSAPPGTQVTLTATDEKASHSTSGSVTISETGPATWTIQ